MSDFAAAIEPTAAGLSRIVLVFLERGGADRGDLMERLVRPIPDGAQVSAIAPRTRGAREPGSMNWLQSLASRPPAGTCARSTAFATQTCAPTAR